ALARSAPFAPATPRSATPPAIARQAPPLLCVPDHRRRRVDRGRVQSARLFPPPPRATGKDRLSRASSLRAKDEKPGRAARLDGPARTGESGASGKNRDIARGRQGFAPTATSWHRRRCPRRSSCATPLRPDSEVRSEPRGQ